MIKLTVFAMLKGNERFVPIQKKMIDQRKKYVVIRGSVDTEYSFITHDETQIPKDSYKIGLLFSARKLILRMFVVHLIFSAILLQNYL